MNISAETSNRVYIALALLALSPLLISFYGSILHTYYDCPHADEFLVGCISAFKYMWRGLEYLLFSVPLAAGLFGLWLAILRASSKNSNE